MGFFIRLTQEIQEVVEAITGAFLCLQAKCLILMNTESLKCQGNFLMLAQHRLGFNDYSLGSCGHVLIFLRSYKTGFWD